VAGRAGAVHRGPAAPAAPGRAVVVGDFNGNADLIAPTGPLNDAFDDAGTKVEVPGWGANCGDRNDRILLRPPMRALGLRRRIRQPVLLTHGHLRSRPGLRARRAGLICPADPGARFPRPALAGQRRGGRYHRCARRRARSTRAATTRRRSTGPRDGSRTRSPLPSPPRRRWRTRPPDGPVRPNARSDAMRSGTVYL